MVCDKCLKEIFDAEKEFDEFHNKILGALDNDSAFLHSLIGEKDGFTH